MSFGDDTLHPDTKRDAETAELIRSLKADVRALGEALEEIWGGDGDPNPAWYHLSSEERQKVKAALARPGVRAEMKGF